ncbi:MAG: efflux RND transporter periplasmic adaptor subunit [Candidatus Zixiibacteriota bacterium]|nr:MAG: efflux RND transporter periplasmic adaptor subunit [candidate division Zixibacteria bacterium]
MAEENKADLASLKIDRDKRYDDRPGSKFWRYFIPGMVIAVVVVGYFLLKDSVSPATKVKVAVVTHLSGSESQASLVASGYVVAQRKAEVASKGTGRLKYLGFEEGDTVLANQVIAELENDDIKANLELARANLLSAEADSLNAGRNFRRHKQLYESGSITLALYEDAETAFTLARASVAASVAAVAAAEVELENTYIRAPFTGTILTKNADVGEMVTPFASAASSKGSVVTLADMGSLEVEADVSESNIHKVKVGQKCDIILDAYPSVSYPGYVKKIVPTADRARATVLTKVAFEQIDDRVLPEMSARVNFFEAGQPVADASLTKAIAVNKDAVTSRDDQKVVFVVEDNEVRMANVETGRMLADKVEIITGLTAGDVVVLSPPGKMVSGQKVEIAN